MGRSTCLSVLIATTALGGCESEAGDSGTAVFTTWGEELIEQQLPADPTGMRGFVDGWTLKYEKFLVVFYEIKLADQRGDLAARLVGSRFVDEVKPGRKTLATFTDIPAKRYDAVSYVIGPATLESDVIAGDPIDRDLMAAGGYSLYVQGAATKGGVTKTFHWGFRTATLYEDCRQPAGSGPAIQGVVIDSDGTDTSELTIQGDRLFHDRAATSVDPAGVKLRFDAIAAADQPGEGFGEITLEELNAVPLGPPYDPTGVTATTLGQYVTALSRTVGGFRGEGLCAITVLR